MDRRRASPVGPGVHVGSTRRGGHLHARCGPMTAAPSARRSSSSSSWCRKRRKRYPDMHIYHYAAYETYEAAASWPRATGSARTRSTICCAPTCSSTCSRSSAAACVSAPVVLSSRRWSRSTWASELRSGEVTNAAASITKYERYRELRDDGRTDEAAEVLKEIGDYNDYDCRSTRRLRDWLLLSAIECGVDTSDPAGRRRATTRSRTLDETARTLMEFAGDGVSEPTAPRSRCAAALFGPRAATTVARTSPSGGRISTD